MIALDQAIQDYLTISRSMGFKLERYGTRLTEFATFLQAAGRTVITEQMALEWVNHNESWSVQSKASRLAVVRRFAEYVRTLDSLTEVPRRDRLPVRVTRPKPHLYSEKEVLTLIQAARKGPTPRLRETYATFFGLLAVTGMRRGEAIRLDVSDFQPRDNLLVVRHSKFGKSREVHLHATTVSVLEAYAAKRKRLWPRASSPSFFLSTTGTRLNPRSVWRNFNRLRAAAGLQRAPGSQPRIHDFRHSFAMRTLMDWHNEGLDVEARLPALSTYLGHVSPTHTYWYLSAVPELACRAGKRLDPDSGGAL